MKFLKYKDYISKAEKYEDLRSKVIEAFKDKEITEEEYNKLLYIAEKRTEYIKEKEREELIISKIKEFKNIKKFFEK